MGVESSSLNKYEVGEIYSDADGVTIASTTNLRDKYTIFQYKKEKRASEKSRQNIEVFSLILLLNCSFLSNH